jgi:hypothetical protein
VRSCAASSAIFFEKTLNKLVQESNLALDLWYIVKVILIAIGLVLALHTGFTEDYLAVYWLEQR